tara:strand:+ start:12343 stop:12561 length:219 start_codon:yes stop_codon:yes gene_type:complete
MINETKTPFEARMAAAEMRDLISCGAIREAKEVGVRMLEKYPCDHTGFAGTNTCTCEIVDLFEVMSREERAA